MTAAFSRIWQPFRGYAVAARVGIGLAALASFAHADTVWVRSTETAAPIPYQNVRVTGIKAGELQYQVLSSGRDTTKPLENVSRILIEGDAAISAAEQAFDEGDFKKAGNAYQRILASALPANKEWIKDRAAVRAIASSERSGDLAGAVTGYIALTGRNIDLAGKARPTVPRDKPQAVAAAAPLVEKALAGGQLPEAQRQALQVLLADMYAATGKTAKAAEMVDRVAQGSPQSAAAPRAAKLQVDLKLRIAAAALEQKDFAKALTELDGVASAADGAAQQADALYLTAQARAGLAKDANAQLDAGIAFMRVVARFGQVQGKPRVADALVRTAEIMEAVQSSSEALALYRQTTQEFAGTPAAQLAQKAIDRLEQNKPAP